MLPEEDLATAAAWVAVAERVGAKASHGAAHDPDPSAWAAAGAADVEAVRAALKRPDGTFGVVVDWGAGAGRLTPHLAVQSEWVYAADACGSCLAGLDEQYPNVGVSATDIPLLAAPVESADLVVSLHVLYSLTPAGVHETIRQLSYLLKPRGFLVLDIPWWLEDRPYHKDPAPVDLPGGWWIHVGMDIMSGWGDEHLWLETAPKPLRYEIGGSPRWSDLAPLSLWVWRKMW